LPGILPLSSCKLLSWHFRDQTTFTLRWKPANPSRWRGSGAIIGEQRGLKISINQGKGRLGDETGPNGGLLRIGRGRGGRASLDCWTDAVEPKREFISIPLLVMTVENYVNTSGDVNLLSRCWDAVKRLCLH
jgi:hypothetical protein